MEMEMDFPLPDELEWLESNALDDESYPDEEEPPAFEAEDVPELGEPPQPSTHRDLSLDPEDDASKLRNHKRRREIDGGGCDLEASGKPSSIEKRSKGVKFGSEEEELDEDWLQYSPQKVNFDEVVPRTSQPDDDMAVEDCPAEAAVVNEENIVSRFASEIDGDFIPVTGPQGDRVYAKMNSGVMDPGLKKVRADRSARGLLLEPVSILMEKVEQDALRKVLQESFPSSDSKQSTTAIVNEQLWVEKYAPKSFMELLSDEQTNREVLLWLKQWDSRVFGSQITTTTDDVLSALRRHTSIAQHQKLFENKFFNRNGTSFFDSQNMKHSKNLENGSDSSMGTNESQIKNSALVSPEQKVLLLCGPPGLGKTTLAHVAARHCGYRVVEINASDERSASTIESKILDVVQMNSVLADAKPKCLVIDEIDGSLGEGKGAVDVILKMIAAEKKASHENTHLEAATGKKSSRKGHKGMMLSRPVICICNDLYAPSLRQLRQIAKVHAFVQPTISRVVNRLKYICKMEGFRTSSFALSALASCTECDIRSCLNTLQFLNKKKENLNILEIDSQLVGRKDISRSAFDIWKEVQFLDQCHPPVLDFKHKFYKVLQKRKVKHGKKQSDASHISRDFEFLYSLISNRGEYELTLDGVYENFLQLSYHDPTMNKTVCCLDALGISDSLLRYTMRTQQMSINAYQPFMIVSLRNLIAQIEKPNIEWPKSLPRYRAMLLEKKDILKLWHSKIPSHISRHLSAESFVEDVVSPLLHILSPSTLRPAALHLLSEKEKDELAQLVDTMASYCMTYKTSKLEPVPNKFKYGATADIQMVSLDPPIDNFVKFKDYQNDHYGLSLAMKQVLVHEVEKHRILSEGSGKSSSAYVKDGNENPPSSTGLGKTCFNKSPGVTASTNMNTLLNKNNSIADSNSNIPDANKNLNSPGATKKRSVHYANFFDRFRKGSDRDPASHGSNLQKLATKKRDMRPFLYKYNEGFTNAVKRPVRMRELFYSES